jgi:hypothetical protein
MSRESKKTNEGKEVKIQPPNSNKFIKWLFDKKGNCNINANKVKLFMQKILSSGLEYNDINPDEFIAVLNFFKSESRVIDNYDTNMPKINSNVKYLYESYQVEYSELINSMISEFLSKTPVNTTKEVLNVLITLIDLKGFPYCKVNCGDESEFKKITDKYPDMKTQLKNSMKNVISFRTPYYGLRVFNLALLVDSVYGLSISEYSDFYSRPDLETKILQLINEHKLHGFIKYNPKKKNIGSIINLPQLARLIFDKHDIKSEEFFTRVEAFVPVKPSFRFNHLSMGAVYALLGDMKNFPKPTKDFMENTSINPLEIPGVVDYFSRTESKGDLEGIKNNDYITNPFYRMGDDTASAILKNQLGLQMRDWQTPQQQLFDFLSNSSGLLLDRFEDLTKIPDISPERYVEFKVAHDCKSCNRSVNEFYCSRRNFNFKDKNVYNLKDCKIIIAIYSIMRDYGVPDKKSNKAYPHQLIKGIVKIFNKSQNVEDVLNTFANILNLDKDLFNFDHFIEILKSGNSDIKFSKEIVERKNKWNELKPIQLELLKAVYNDQFLNLRKFIDLGLKGLNDAPKEYLVIDSYDEDEEEEEYLNELLENVGMVRSEFKSPLEYILETLPTYPKTSGDNLTDKTDQELIEIIGGYPGHMSRKELIDIAQQRGPKFLMIDNKTLEGREFEPLISTGELTPSSNVYNICYVYDSCYFTISELTCYNTDLKVDNVREVVDEKGAIVTKKVNGKDMIVYEEIAEPSLVLQPLSFYKNNFAFRISENIPKEVLKSFERVIEASYLYFKRILLNDKDMTVDEVEDYDINGDIEEDTEEYPIIIAKHSLQYMLNRIKEVNMRHTELDSDNKNVYMSYISYPTNIRQMILESLVILFDCGMNQRQWRIENDPERKNYPYTKEQSGTELGFDHSKDQVVGDKLIELINIIDAIGAQNIEAKYFVWNLLKKNLEYMDGKHTESTNSILTEKKRIIETYITEPRLFWENFFPGRRWGGEEIKIINGKTYRVITNEWVDVRILSPEELKTTVDERNLPEEKKSIITRQREVNTTLFDVIYIIGLGESRGGDAACIRSASIKLITIAYFYLNLFQEKQLLGNYDWWRIEAIQ